MRTTDFLFLLLIWVFFLLTPHRGKATVILFVVLMFNMISLVQLNIQRGLPNYIEGDIKPGNVVSTFHHIIDDRHHINQRRLATLMNGYSYFHTALAVEHKGKTYILNTAPDFVGYRGHSPYLDQIEIVSTKGFWTMYLEPLESFLSEERVSESSIRIIDTGHWIAYEKTPQLDSMFPSHCCYHLAKYMESLGLCENKSSLHDIFYYMPQYFLNRFHHKKDIRLTRP